MKKLIIIILVAVAIVGLWLYKNMDYKPLNTTSNKEDVGSKIVEVDSEIKESNDNSQYPMLYIDTINFEELLEYDLPIMLHMGASWCGPCQQMKPYLEELYEEYLGKVLIAYVDVDRVNIEGYPLSVVPTQFFYNSDGSPFIPSEEIVMKNEYSWVPFYHRETDELVFSTHQGLLTREELENIFVEMINR